MWKITLAVLFFIATAHADTTWINGPTVSGNWDSTGTPYMISDYVNIHEDSALTISEGVQVFFMGGLPFNVDGSLQVNGSEEAPVVFTTDTLTYPNRWRGIKILATADSVRMTYAIIEYTNSTGSSLGAIRTWADLDLDHVTIRNNHTYGLRANGVSLLNLVDCIIDNNGIPTGGGSGGGISLYDVNATLTGCRIANNHALDGGGIYALLGELRLYNCVIENDSALLWGGGAYIDNDIFEAHDCIIRSNQGVSGPGIEVLSEETLIDRCLFQGNFERDGTSGIGGAIKTNTLNGIIQRCTFVNNRSGNGSAIHASNLLTVQNCIFSSNDGSAAVYTSAPPIIVQYCNFFRNFSDYDGNVPNDFGNINTINLNGDSCDQYFNIFMNPLFENPDEGDYHLSDDSPCIDAGNPELELDPDSTIADIGAFYFPQEISAVEPNVVTMPQSVNLYPAYPNPFNPIATISFDIPSTENIKVVVFDITGREAATLSNGIRGAGNHKLSWNGSNFSSGIYFVVLSTQSEQLVQKLFLLK